MKQVKDIVKRFAILDESSLSDWKGSRSMQMYPMVRADGTPVKETQRKNRLEFRRQPKHATAAGAMAALSHALAQRNSHWAYADEIARRRFGEAEVENLTAMEIAQIIAVIKKQKENQ